MTEKPWRSRRKRSQSEPDSERQDTNQTGEEDPNLERFGWKPGDLRVLYDPYTEEEKVDDGDRDRAGRVGPQLNAPCSGEGAMVAVQGGER